MKNNVILIDNDVELLAAAKQTLELNNCEVQTFSSALDALKNIKDDFSGVIISDIRMPNMDGLELFAAIKKIDAQIPIILITGHGDIALAVKTMQQGAYDFIAKPFASDHLVQSVNRAQQQRNLVLENRHLKRNLAASIPLIGQSAVMQQLRQTIATLAPTNVDVLIMGETGTGKEVVANALHNLSERSKNNLVTLNCGAMPENILESELFGHEAGAFTGALKKRIGMIEHSNNGTLFLDELESMPLAAQVRLLRVLEQREITPIGSNKVIKLNLRIVAASKADLLELCAQGKFRTDLYYRLQVATIYLPPLKDRTEDISLLYQHFVQIAATKLNLPLPKLTSAISSYLLQHNWSGNVRELAHFAERVVLGMAGTLSSNVNGANTNLSLPQMLEQYEAALIKVSLQENSGNIVQTLTKLQIPRRTLYDKLAKYQIKAKDYEKS